MAFSAGCGAAGRRSVAPKRNRMTDSGKNRLFDGERSLCGIVSEGDRIGRRIGFPTANIVADGRPEIPDGVFAAEVVAMGRTYRAVVNVGRRPTVGEGLSRTLEAHLLGFSGDLYGQRIVVRLLERIREERKFESLDALRRRIEQDRQYVARMPQEAFPVPDANETTKTK